MIDANNIAEGLKSLTDPNTWIKVNKTLQPSNIPNIQNDIQASDASPSTLECVLGISANTTTAIAGIPKAANELAALVTLIKRDDNEDVICSSEIQAQQKVEYKRSQKQFKSINNIIINSGQTLNLFGQALIAGTHFAQEITTLVKTLQSDDDNKDKDPIKPSFPEIVALEVQRRNDRRHVKTLCNQAIGVFKSSGDTLQLLTSLAVQTNNNLQTIERIMASCNQRFQAQTIDDVNHLHMQDIENSNNQVRMIKNVARTTGHLSNAVNSGERIVTNIRQIVESPNFEHKVTHIRNNMVKTFGSITCMTVGGLLLYKHLMNHVDQKSTILASLGAGLITVPWIISCIDK